MIFKPFKGGLATVSYQMRNPTAKVLFGNPRQTSRLIQASKFAQPYCGMTLSFEEEVLPADETRILDEFVNLIRGSLEPDALDILVVRHTDKKNPKTGKVRTDYHITTVETELRTGKHITIYHYIKDHDIFYAWERMVNIRHNFSRPDDPGRRRSTQIPRRIGKDRKAALEAIDKAVSEGVIAGRIKDRYDVITFLEKAGFVITRHGKDYLGIKDQDGKTIRLKGLFYDCGFDSGKLGKSPLGRPAGADAGAVENLGDVENRFSKLFAYRVKKFQKLYRTGRNKGQTPAVGGVGDDNFVRAADIVFDPKRRTVSPEVERSGADIFERPPRLGGVGGTGADSVRRPDKFPGRSDVYRGEKIEGINYEDPTIGIDQDTLGQIGSCDARSRGAADATAGIFRATTAAMGKESGRLVGAGAGLAAAIDSFLEVVNAFDQAVKFARNPLGYLTRFLIKKIRIKQQQRLPVAPQIKFRRPKIS